MVDAHDSMPLPAREGELSVRDKAVEIQPGVYVTQMRTVPVRIGKGVEENARHASRLLEALGESALNEGEEQ